MSLPAFLFLVCTAENRTLCRARALGKRVSVFSPRARTPAGGRSRCGFAKQIRGFSAQSPSPKQMRCLSNLNRPCAASTDHLKPAENRTLCRARALGKRYSNAEWDALSQQSSNGNCVPEYRLRMGCIFRMGCWRKVHPGIRAQNGSRFPNGGPSGKHIPESRLKLGRTFRFACRLKKPARPPPQNWVEESQNAIAGGQYDCRR